MDITFPSGILLLVDFESNAADELIIQISATCRQNLHVFKHTPLQCEGTYWWHLVSLLHTSMHEPSHHDVISITDTSLMGDWKEKSRETHTPVSQKRNTHICLPAEKHTHLSPSRDTHRSVSQQLSLSNLLSGFCLENCINSKDVFFWELVMINNIPVLWVLVENNSVGLFSKCVTYHNSSKAMGDVAWIRIKLV